MANNLCHIHEHQVVVPPKDLGSNVQDLQAPDRLPLAWGRAGLAQVVQGRARENAGELEWLVLGHRSAAAREAARLYAIPTRPQRCS